MATSCFDHAHYIRLRGLDGFLSVSRGGSLSVAIAHVRPHASHKQSMSTWCSFTDVPVTFTLREKHAGQYSTGTPTLTKGGGDSQYWQQGMLATFVQSPTSHAAPSLPSPIISPPDSLLRLDRRGPTQSNRLGKWKSGSRWR